jgi:hypothetical protein
MSLKSSFNVQAKLGLDSITMLSIRHPSVGLFAGVLLESLPIRQRRTIIWPAAEAGRFTTVVMKPSDEPLQAARPPSGLLSLLSSILL